MSTRDPAYYRDILNQLLAEAPEGPMDLEPPSREDMTNRRIDRMLRSGITALKALLGPRFRNLTEGSDSLILEFDARDLPCGTTPMSSMEIWFHDEGQEDEPAMIQLLPKARDHDAHGMPEWNENDHREDVVIEWASEVLGNVQGIEHVEFIDWNHDDNPWYTLMAVPGSTLDILSTPRAQQILRNMD